MVWHTGILASRGNNRQQVDSARSLKKCFCKDLFAECTRFAGALNMTGRIRSVGASTTASVYCPLLILSAALTFGPASTQAAILGFRPCGAQLYRR